MIIRVQNHSTLSTSREITVALLAAIEFAAGVTVVMPFSLVVTIEEKVLTTALNDVVVAVVAALTTAVAAKVVVVVQLIVVVVVVGAVVVVVELVLFSDWYSHEIGTNGCCNCINC
uniref:Transmembrane protein n=1 Tax=Glossina brevipalpis TaxID=37001 RepID=A0A1A9WWR2_9MUSC